MTKFRGFMGLAALLCSLLCMVSVPSGASGGSGGGGNGGGGNGGGGGGTKIVEARVTGYVTAIDYEHSTITIGSSYYGTGVLKVDSSTKISLDNSNCDLTTIRVGHWSEARYDVFNGTATKLACTTLPSS